LPRRIGRTRAHAFARERFGVETIAELLMSDLDLTLIASHTYRDTMIDHAVMSNFHRNPEQSARRAFTMPQIFVCCAILAGFVAWGYLDVRSMLIAVIGVLQVFFLASTAFKVVLSIAGVGFINSTTFEEANADLGNWIRQRSRWVKGYMQTTGC
jgi:hypothetical protein